VTALVMAAAAATVAGSASDAEVSSSRETVGHSVEGRPLKVTLLGSATADTRVLVVGSLHGDEPEGRKVVRRLLKAGGVPSDVELYLMRALNPDGLRMGTRQNARGVDLNRNFPRGWEHQGEPGSRYYSGPRPLSEPESRAAARLVRRIDPTVTIWYHQPYGMVVEAPRADRRLVHHYAREVGLPTGRLPGLHGTATRWQNARDPSSTAFVVELAAGRLAADQARRHVRAVRSVARLARQAE
jgi:protein MpaA